MQAPPSQPLILLATCHCNPNELPQALLAFFSGTNPVGLDSVTPDSIILLEQDLPEPTPSASSHDAAVQHAPAGALPRLPEPVGLQDAMQALLQYFVESILEATKII